MNLIFLPKIRRAVSDDQRQAAINRDLIRREAKIGGQLFGPVPAGHNREFFCLDEHTWVWHEDWMDANGQRQVVTTRYEVRPGAVVKIQNGHSYQSLSYDEALNLYKAVELYEERVMPLYQQQVSLAA